MWEYQYSGSEDYLAHHGILGMKWGIRRYQNEDGTLTVAGKKRYEKNARTIEKTPGRVFRRVAVSAASAGTSAAALKTGVDTLPITAKAALTASKGASYIAYHGGALIGGEAAKTGTMIAGQQAVKSILTVAGAMNPTMLAVGAGAAGLSAAALLAANYRSSRGKAAKRQNERLDRNKRLAEM